MLVNIKGLSLAVLIFSSALAWVSFFSIVFFISPQNAGKIGFAALYLSGSLGLVSLPIILWQIIKLKKK